VRVKTERRQNDVLDVLRSSNKPLSAYKILEILQTREPDIAPPTVYRTLFKLIENGQAHRLESLKAFVPCSCNHSMGTPMLTICDTCGAVDERDVSKFLPRIFSFLSRRKFNVNSFIMEVHGECGTCQSI